MSITDLHIEDPVSRSLALPVAHLRAVKDAVMSTHSIRPELASIPAKRKVIKSLSSQGDIYDFEARLINNKGFQPRHSPLILLVDEFAYVEGLFKRAYSSLEQASGIMDMLQTDGLCYARLDLAEQFFEVFKSRVKAVGPEQFAVQNHLESLVRIVRTGGGRTRYDQLESCIEPLLELRDDVFRQPTVELITRYLAQAEILKRHTAYQESLENKKLGFTVFDKEHLATEDDLTNQLEVMSLLEVIG